MPPEPTLEVLNKFGCQVTDFYEPLYQTALDSNAVTFEPYDLDFSFDLSDEENPFNVSYSVNLTSSNDTVVIPSPNGLISLDLNAPLGTFIPDYIWPTGGTFLEVTGATNTQTTGPPPPREEVMLERINCEEFVITPPGGTFSPTLFTPDTDSDSNSTPPNATFFPTTEDEGMQYIIRLELDHLF